MCEPANPPSQCQSLATHFHALKLFAFPSLQRNSSAINHDQLPHFAENGGANRDRTDDLKLAKLALSQLSYGPVVVVEIVGHSSTALMAFLPSIGPPNRSIARRATGVEVVGLGRLELPTSRLSSARSNQLSYKPDEASCIAERIRPAARRKKGRETRTATRRHIV